MKTALGVILGAVIGAALGYFGKCRGGGGCPIAGNPIGGLLFGAAIGGLLASQFGGTVKYTPSSSFVEVSSVDQFKALLAGKRVVLVDFYADWCGPCRRLKPTIHELADEFAGKATVAGVNVDKLGTIAREYSVRGIPDVRLFVSGNSVETFVGMQRKKAYADAINKALGGPGGSGNG